MSKLKTTEEFIKQAKKIHGDKYDYSNTNYSKAREKVLIHCNTCGNNFWQIPCNHLRGRGCIRCGGSKKLTTKEFIQCAKEIHGNKYDYSHVFYSNNRAKIKIYCNKCKKFFWQIAANHLKGFGCRQCAIPNRLTTESFIRRAKEIHGNKYNYSGVEYEGIKKKIKIYCNICKEYFWQTPSSHLCGRGCIKCGFINSRRKHSFSLEKFIEKAKRLHQNKYDYTQSKYKNCKTKIKIYCNKCKKFFWQTPDSHLAGKGCPECIISKKENFIRNWLTIQNINYISQKRFKDCKDKYPLPFDFYLPDYDLCIEFQGIQHYKKYLNKFAFRFKTEEALYKWFNTQKKHDKIKYNFCKENGIKLIRIRFDDNIEKVLKKNIKNS